MRLGSVGRLSDGNRPVWVMSMLSVVLKIKSQAVPGGATKTAESVAQFPSQGPRVVQVPFHLTNATRQK